MSLWQDPIWDWTPASLTIDKLIQIIISSYAKIYIVKFVRVSD